MKIIMISLDTLRADRLGCYGYGKPTTPYIDQIASEGVLMERAYAADIPTEVAHSAIFTGSIGLTTGLISHGSDLSYLSKSVEWLPSILKAAGFTTGAVDNLYNMKEWFARGYRYYMNSSGKKRWIDGRTVNDLALPWIKEHKDEDFFLFLHYWDAHTPYLPPDSYITPFYGEGKNPYDKGNSSMNRAYGHPAYPFFKHHHYNQLGPVTDADYISALYDAEVRYLDDLIRELDEYLMNVGIREETLLILFGDHGESLTEHDIYWDHCGLYEQTVHVPVIMRWPGHIPVAKRVKGFVQHADLMPTILEAVAAEAETGIDLSALRKPDNLDGQSLWSSINGEADGTMDEVFLSECAWQAARAIRTERYKLIRNYDTGPFQRPEQELYDLQQDPEELINLAKKLPHMAEELEAKLNVFVSSKLNGRPDPMMIQINEAQLPFRRRIELILGKVGLTWESWIADPQRVRYDILEGAGVYSQHRKSGH
ncbi:sulfatase-like hydrolase/transferase [Paenibacillus sp. LMG 31456]|uniref:Sulfatase-like hydrolase/transferase n=1 Tax=Paenibacillus foliorum TaxID=2654974 RepID=A0A972GRT8_9BACL|nr:sulfatase [Paenibacillus foliorum]NOU93299.1 sulfatase-like hydrolase/transferase [Paenibacillus foliorum]